MDSAAAGEQRARIDGDHPSARVLLGEDRHRVRVVGIAESAGDDAAVDHEVIDVAVVDVALGVGQRCRSGHLGDLPGAPRRVVAGIERSPDGPAHRVVGMGLIALGVQQQPAG